LETKKRGMKTQTSALVPPPGLELGSSV